MLPTSGPIEYMLGPFVLSFLVLFSTQAFATLSYTQSSGASAVDLTDRTKPIFYGGFAGSCSSTDGTCDSCDGSIVGTTGLVPCNPTNISPSTVLTLVFTSTTPITIQPEARMTNSTGVTLGTVTWTLGATSFTLSIPWSDICNNAPSNADGSCKKDINVELYVAIGSTGSGSTGSGSTTTTTSTTVKVATRFADTALTSAGTWNYIDCPTEDNNTEKVGFCHFLASPGDEKIYADELAVASSFPASNNSAVQFKNLVFFYEIQTDADVASGGDAATVARITNASPMFLLGVNAGTTPPVTDSRIDGLSNGARYCMVMASQDTTGVISYFTPVTGGGAVSASAICTTPEPVTGLLDDKHCFIATAAFGSDMAPEVKIFREFRNKFLLPYSWGKKFVRAYYHHSPKYAALISSSELLRAMARTVLWPLLFFIQMSLQLGIWSALVIIISMIFLTYLIYGKFIQKRELKGQL